MTFLLILYGLIAVGCGSRSASATLNILREKQNGKLILADKIFFGPGVFVFYGIFWPLQVGAIISNEFERI